MARGPFDRYLADGERLVISIRRHPIVLAGPTALALAAIVAASALGFLAGPRETNDIIDTALGLVALAAVVRLAWKLWLWSADRVVVTDRRFIQITGILTRNVATIPLARVTDMTYRRSIGGRLFGYGDLILETAGQDQAFGRLDHIPHPDDFYRTVTALATATLPEPEADVAFRPFTGWDEEDTGPLPRVIV